MKKEEKNDGSIPQRCPVLMIKKADRRQPFKNSRTARMFAPSNYVLCPRDDGIGGNCRSILFAMSRAFLFAGMNDLREDDFFRLVFRM